MTSLLPAGKGGKAARRLPEGAKETLQDFVVDVLRKKITAEKFVSYAAEWFNNRKEKEAESLKAHEDTLHTPSTIGPSWSPGHDPSTFNFLPPSSLDAEHPTMDPPTVHVEATPSTVEEPVSVVLPVVEYTPSTYDANPSQWVAPDASTMEVSPVLPVVEDHLTLPRTSNGQSAVSLAPTDAYSAVTVNEAVAQPESTMEMSQAEQTAGVQPTDISGDSGAAAARRQGVSAESYDPSAPVDLSTLKSFPKSEEQMERVKAAVKEVLLFRSLDDDQLNKVIDALEEFTVQEGTEVIKHGDEVAEHFYVIESGNFDVHVPIKGEMTKVASYAGQGSFGELALMYNQPRAATVIATSEGKVWRLDRETFRSIVLRGAFQKRELYKQLMDKVDFLADLQSYEKEKICDALQAKSFNSGDTVMRQGETGDGMYFVESGEVVCLRSENGDEAKEIARVGPGQYVGELALIANQPRAATVTATVDGTRLAFLDSKAFERLMGPCIDLLRKNIDKYKDKITAVFGENTDFLK